MNIVSTIVPIFVIIFLGLFSKQKGFFSPDFINQANRLVYYIAIPAMIFSAISKAALKTQLNLPVIVITLLTVGLVTTAAWLFSRGLTISESSKGTFIQSSFHGNLGYIGLAVAFYYLGDNGLVKAAIIAGFVMILQNLLAVVVLQHHSDETQDGSKMFHTIKKTLANPVILSAIAGILFSLYSVPIPAIIDRSLVILKGMALPMALLIIGASLSFEKLKSRFFSVLLSSVLKLIVMPGIGLVVFKLFSIPNENYLPGLIILSAPTATLTYILGKQIGGDPDFAVAAISICTILSGVTYGVWLSLP